MRAQEYKRKEEKIMRRLRFKRMFSKILLFIVALMLIIMGVGNIALQVAGKSTVAKVMDYEQVLYLSNDDSSRNPNRYKVNYQFAVEGQQYRGSVTRVFKDGSHMRETMAVLYLTMRPSINGEDRGNLSPTGLVLIASGVVLFILSLRN